MCTEKSDDMSWLVTFQVTDLETDTILRSERKICCDLNTAKSITKKFNKICENMNWKSDKYQILLTSVQMNSSSVSSD